MQFTKMLGIAGLVAGVTMSYSVIANDAATAEEVVSKVQAAAEALSKAGEAGLADFKGEGNKWKWKDTYVFVYDCKADKALAHPTLEGKPVLSIKDKAGKDLFVELCKAGEGAHGGWVSYMWPKPGAQEPTQKVSYALAVKGTSYQVSAGIYDEKAKVEDLNAALAKH